jgi:hypothetical protein
MASVPDNEVVSCCTVAGSWLVIKFINILHN